MMAQQRYNDDNCTASRFQPPAPPSGHSLAEVEVDLVCVEEVADPTWGSHDAMDPHLLDRVDLAALVLPA